MEKTQVYLPKEELDALRKAAARSGRSMAELVREAIRKVVLKPPATGRAAIWAGQPRRPATEQDIVHDDPGCGAAKPPPWQAGQGCPSPVLVFTCHPTP